MNCDFTRPAGWYSYSDGPYQCQNPAKYPDGKCGLHSSAPGPSARRQAGHDRRQATESAKTADRQLREIEPVTVDELGRIPYRRVMVLLRVAEACARI